MNDTHQVISAFLDDEPVDANALTLALGDPEGRALFIDLLALRHVVQPATARIEPKRRSPLRALAAAAAIVTALVGGYIVGRTRNDGPHAAAPAPTRVVEATAEWQTLP